MTPSWAGAWICFRRKVLQRDLDRLGQWSPPVCRAFSKGKCQVLHPGLTSPMGWYRFGEEQLESCPAGKKLEVLLNSWLNTSQPRVQVAKKAANIWAYIRNGMASMTGK